jgi:uncharacterized caspase-like protein
MRAFAVIVATLLAFAAMPATAEEQRIALVVGNNKYTSGLRPLDNAVPDAELITRELTDAGFDVERVPNADWKDMSEAITRFTSRLKEAGPGAVGLFYFAGHGLQHRGTNYLLPTDATVDDADDLSNNGLDATRVLWAMQDGGARTMIVILDACRSNPVAKTAGPIAEEGLAEFDTKALDKKRSVLIVYSTGVDETAADGEKEDGNSPFASILAENMRVPDQEISDMIRTVSLQMVENFDQKPWQNNGMLRSFAFVGEPR